MIIKQLFLIILPFLLFYAVNSNLPKLKSNQKTHKVLIPDKYARLISIGHKELLSSILWIDIIQNSTITKDESLFEYNRADVISSLSPLFYQNYKFNSLTISIVKDQFHNSNKLIRKGLQYFPIDYDLLFQHGFNSFFLLEDRLVGINYFKKIYNENLYHEKNSNFPIIYSNVQKKIGHKELSKKILYDLYINTDNEKLKKVLLKRLN